MPEVVPTLPFPEFKWKWASLQPTESLNRPEYFVGVLRALERNEGRSKSDRAFNDDLMRIQTEIGLQEGATLARSSPERNIIRNAGQYWKVLGVLGPERPITLTPLGHLYANRDINMQEFALHTVLNFTLPSLVYNDEEITAWRTAGITFRPLLLILQVVAAMEDISDAEAYLSETELAHIVQPLSATTIDAVRIARAIADYRNGRLDIGLWPRPQTKDNDYRISAEFLLFLAAHNLLRQVDLPGADKMYELGFITSDEIRELAETSPRSVRDRLGLERVSKDLSFQVERRRVLREVYARPGQTKFREGVLRTSQMRCLLTGTRLPGVLQAAHVRPVSSEGSDSISNGICLRSDIHTLFDANRIRIRPDGCVSYSDEVLQDPTYADLPEAINLPEHVSKAAFKWRWEFI